MRGLAELPERQERRRLLILSHVLPFPRNAGQQQRVFYTLQAARELFHVTFATVANEDEAERTREQLHFLCDEVILLPSRYTQGAARLWHRSAGAVYALASGLKRSNYAIGRVEFHPERIAELLAARQFDCVLYEYWHAVESIPVFRQRGIPCVLDMHDVLWKSFERDLKPRSGVSAVWKRWAVQEYKKYEEWAWAQFDGIVAINRVEEELVRPIVPAGRRIFYAPMGTDAQLWPYCPEPSEPPRVAYYGGLANPHNEKSARQCATEIMPLIWQQHPATELWLVGSNPPDSLRRLSSDPRIKITGYVEDVQKILRTMSAVICPWTGPFGFRSRLIEVMALGVPVVASPDAVSGMELEDGQGVLLGENDADLARQALRLIGDPSFAHGQGQAARRQVERSFSVERTYGKWMTELDEWLVRMRAGESHYGRSTDAHNSR